jgi:hypothetical protein
LNQQRCDKIWPSEGQDIEPQTDWQKLIPEEQWRIYILAIEAIRSTGVRFMIGGAFGLACYTGRWRNTKDLDFYVPPHERDKVIAALTEAGFTDLYDQVNYDRRWIYRSIKEGVIVDVIWAMANQRAQVENDWFDHALPVTLHGQPLQAIAAEELLWCKLYVLQRDRCDWPDVLNLLYAVGPQLDWDRLLSRVDAEICLLSGVLCVFKWISPERASQIPKRLQKLVPCDSSPALSKEMQRRRVQWLDSRSWFAAYQPEDEPLQL